MKTSVVHYFSDDTLSHIGSEYFIDGENVSLPDYADFMQGLYEENGTNLDAELEEDDSCDDCACSQEDNCEECDCGECLGCDDTECCEENRENEGEELEAEYCDCECPICDAERDIEDIECFCDECEEDFIKDTIEECLERVFDGCPDCAIDSVIKLAYKCLEFGKENAKQNMMEFLET
jgi:hypothetical protein